MRNGLSKYFSSILLLVLIFLGMKCNAPDSDNTRARRPKGPRFVWSLLTDSSRMPRGDRIQILNIRDTLWAFGDSEILFSVDGRQFSRSTLNVPPGKTCSYLYYRDQVLAFPFASGTPGIDTIFATADLQHWKVLGSFADIKGDPVHLPIIYNGKLLFTVKDSTSPGRQQEWISADAQRWKKPENSPPVPLSAHSRMITFKKINFLFDSSAWQQKGPGWKKLAPLPWIRSDFSVALLDDRMWLIPAMAVNDDPHVYSSSRGQTWDSLPLPWKPRGPLSTVVFRGNLLISEHTPGLVDQSHSKSTIWMLHPTRSQESVSNNVDE